MRPHNSDSPASLSVAYVERSRRAQRGVQILRSSREIAQMRKAGLLVWQALQLAGSMVRPGVTTAEIDAAVERFFEQHHAVPLFKGVPGRVPFPAVTCISVNEEVVHGIPGPRRLEEGDIVSIDTGCKLNGWCGDSAVTFPVGKIAPEVQTLLDVTQRDLGSGHRADGQEGMVERSGRAKWKNT